ncbi:unnamed protein product [Musa acuminata subsp. malaccensis]|uniref:non-specific serine/threonine protein kinase n=1 Tax=Musa acuminata subsp. malaccensis TaxID=214687 RepID=A0A8D7EYD6_MUSAM|nr:unnamed protein product [Musa acuminata subsp. malaccensis]
MGVTMECCFSSGKMASVWCFVLLGLAMAVLPVHCQSTDALGFISIDNGIAPGTTYIDPKSNITYVSDTGFIDTGENHNISGAYVTNGMARRWLSLRSFPSGTRNCYRITSITKGSKYLVRAWFMYGNYDGMNTQPLLFDLYLGVNLWANMNITGPDQTYTNEVITVASSDVFSVCLLNTGHGTPFISGLDVRPLKDMLYPAVNASRSLVLFKRLNMGHKGTYVRYPDDRHDRLWEPWSLPIWTDISTTSTVENLSEDYFEAPSAVMQTAVTPVNSTTLLLSWDPYPGDVNQYFPILHISDFLKLSGTNVSRQFYVYVNGIQWLGNPMTPDYLFSDAVYSIHPLGQFLSYNITLVALSNSTLPPILNALEIFSTLSNANVPSNDGDVNAMMAIKAWYKIKRNWMGDPCTPTAFSWDGLNCTFSVSIPPRITTLNLSTSGLTGEITKSFASLGAIEYLDLSYNNLTGTIPAVLAELTSLKLLDLTRNQLNGSIPSALLERSQNGFLTLRIEGNPYLCENGTSCKVTPSSKKKKITTPVIVILCIVPVTIVLMVILIICRLKRQGKLSYNKTLAIPQNEVFSNQVKDHRHDPLQLENRQFTYMELKNITNNFQKVLGKGGFGTVFYGCLEDGTEVAVKMRSQASSQGTDQFLAEAQHLTRVHHRTLVSMVGYCNDGDYLALVYEYMAQGTLQDHLQGRTHSTRPLSWRQRLLIAVEAAEGLEYLHKGCKPALIHRDVKTANILLSEKLEAKIADFGLSKAFQSEVNTHVSTAVVGTPGYLDPEYYNTFQISEKSDVYSFGVVLLELITGQPPIVQSAEHAHIVQRVRQRLGRGNIEDVVDAKLQGNYDVNSVWKCADIALKCTSQASHQRPTMADVVMQLKESLELETSPDRTENLVTCSENLYTEVSNISDTNSALEIENIARMSDVCGPSISVDDDDDRLLKKKTFVDFTERRSHHLHLHGAPDVCVQKSHLTYKKSSSFSQLHRSSSHRKVGVGDHTRNTDGFISIDCGIADGYSYTDAKTTIPYNSDTNYVATGVNHNISTRFDSNTTIATQDRTLRSFPQDKRSCYTLPVEEGRKYLVRATFLHGNYDGRKVSSVDPILFDLHLGVNLWESVNISDVTRTHESEVITVALAGYISVCLVNKDKGTPFISSLELRPLRKETLYPAATASVALVKHSRFDFGGSIELRFPDDPYDRIWTPFDDDNKWTRIRTTSPVQSRFDDMFEVPSAVLQTAVVPINSTKAELLFEWGLPDYEDVRPQFNIFMHFAELQPLAVGQSRNFTVYLNGNPWLDRPYSPPYLLSGYIYSTVPSYLYQYNVSIKETATSTLPPIINALETYTIMQLTENATDGSDVDAIGAIKKRYKVNRNWIGDPCAPEVYKWDGLDCSYSVSDSPRITAVHLSSGGLMGTIDSSFAELKAIKYLNLSNNQLTGFVPSALLLRTQNGSLTLRIEGNPNLCADGDSCTVTPTSTKKKISTPLIVILCIVAVVLLVVIVMFWRLRKRRGLNRHGGTMQVTDNHDRSLQLENRQFPYTELKNITNNFAKVLGKGGFGTVYHGYLEDCTEVAVKMRSQSSSQDTKEFFAEAQSLTRVHHRNLVSLIGYCKDRDSLALVYEYMSQGTLRDHLQVFYLTAHGLLHGSATGRNNTAIALSWGQRLHIAVDAAQGLEYLHKGCRPPLIHRDVKTANILLSERLEAKIADFGLSKTFQNEVSTHVSTTVVGTPGYLDPEYYNNYQLSEKTDVYSFGVVLLELITGQPPLLQVSGGSHIIQRVRRGLATGNVEDIVDARLQGEYDVNSVWKCVDVALKCTSQRSQQRPTMTDVVMQLKESLELQTPRDRIENPITSKGERYMEEGDAIESNPYVVEMTLVSSGPLAR